MTHSTRTGMSYAKWSVTRHPPRSYLTKLEDTNLERPVRRMLERLSRELDGVNFKSQDGRYDFWLMGVPIDVQGPFHERQTQRDHDAFKAGEIIKAGLPVPILIEGKAIRKTPELVYQVLRAVALLHGARMRETTP